MNLGSPKVKAIPVSLNSTTVLLVVKSLSGNRRSITLLPVLSSVFSTIRQNDYSSDMKFFILGNLHSVMSDKILIKTVNFLSKVLT